MDWRSWIHVKHNFSLYMREAFTQSLTTYTFDKNKTFTSLKISLKFPLMCCMKWPYICALGLETKQFTSRLLTYTYLKQNLQILCPIVSSVHKLRTLTLTFSVFTGVVVGKRLRSKECTKIPCQSFFLNPFFERQKYYASLYILALNFFLSIIFFINLSSESLLVWKFIQDLCILECFWSFTLNFSSK